MKILHVTPFFKPSWEAGGPPRSVYETARRQVTGGHEVTVFTTDGFKKRLNVEKNVPVDVEGIETYYFRNLSMFLAGGLNFPVPYYMPLVVRKKLKEFDIIHIHEHRTFLAAIIHRYAKKYDIPYIIQPRGSAPTMIKSRQKEIFDKLLGKSIIYDACKIIASSHSEASQYRDVFMNLDLDSVVQIPNGIDLKIYQKLPFPGTFREKMGIKEDEKIILYLSRLHERKGIGLLLKSFKSLIDKIDKIGLLKLVIAGPDDHYLDKINHMVQELGIENSVIIPGPLYENDKLESYVDADVFVLPSRDRYESFGNVVVEAMACNTPVVVTKYCGISEWVSPNEGQVIDYQEDQLEKALMDILQNDLKRDSMAQKAREVALNTFDWETVVKDTQEVYEKCIK
ncbi:MAG: glycosyltransferase [Methanobacteriaceae archaeon]|nr:glycosyltransferase [Methanobacteriaceae archaeon]MDP2836312.1 glycosyltransferase [Methanobacteriaceae archaeon]MDP3035207.1 glycosyltransferase [Methanobacteriaceae archaeon]MDP3485101.1 glycosyltransferase [Methanobacteriaceae archaeon]MDP3624029.1 glycosyltransferase [Methanobacteriaceae archaeon]